jgi:glycosyltransferase involved in cell wall biosynthesis
MKILTVLTYYRPHTSGLTIYAERLALALAKRGNQVTVMTTQYDKDLPREEMLGGVRVVRVPVALRIGKGVLAPTFGFVATRLVAENDVIHLHLPQFDAPGVALRARLFGKPVILTYHCDLLLPPGLINRMINSVVIFQNNIAAILSNHIVTYTQDYADHSAYLSRYRKKLSPLLPPVVLPTAPDERIEKFSRLHQTQEKNPVIGMVTRFAAEKGVEILLDALPLVLDKYPKAQVLFAGQYQDVMGEHAYAERLMPRIKMYQDSGNWSFLGNLSQEQLAAFYPNLDVLVVPSLNSTEAFGLVQIEAMMHNVPCIASDLPGVRRPVQMHAMGKVIPIGDPLSLAQALIDVINGKEKYSCDPKTLYHEYDPNQIAAKYEGLFERIKANHSLKQSSTMRKN